MKDFLIKAAVGVYLVIAFLVGVQKHRQDRTPGYGTVVTVLEGAGWPITLLIEAVQRK